MHCTSSQHTGTTLTAWLMGGCLFLVSTVANALTLGELELNSRLNEPLQATIPLNASQAELASLEVRLASEQAFKRFGIAHGELLNTLQFEIVETPSKPQIKITSNSPIREPLLEFVLSISWGNGKVLKDFAAFLSP